ncbi:MAG: DJ-1/PfpI family protein [Psychroflexus halocasei]
MVACNRNANEKTEATVAENNTEQAIDDKENNNTKVAFLIYPEIAILDMTGPMDAFIKINRMTENQYDVYTVSATTDVIKTQGHIVEIKAEYTFENAPVPDILIIPGAKLDVVQNLAEQADYSNFIKEQSAQAKTTMSVCTGSFVLGKLGLLDGKKATTHWILGNKFEDDFKNVELVRDVRYVKDGNIITTSGVTTGIDGAIAIIEEYTNPDFAAMASRGLQYETKIAEKWPAMPTKPMNHGDSDPTN